jgi:hypothetical protein
MYPDRDVYGNPVQTPDGHDVYSHPTMGDVTYGSYGPEPVSPPPPPPTTWDN